MSFTLFQHLFCPKTYYSILLFTCCKVNSNGNEDLWLLLNRESLKEMLVISQLLKKSNNCIQQWAGKHSEMLRIHFFKFEKQLLKSAVYVSLNKSRVKNNTNLWSLTKDLSHLIIESLYFNKSLDPHWKINLD